MAEALNTKSLYGLHHPQPYQELPQAQVNMQNTRLLANGQEGLQLPETKSNCVFHHAVEIQQQRKFQQEKVCATCTVTSDRFGSDCPQY